MKSFNKGAELLKWVGIFLILGLTIVFSLQASVNAYSMGSLETVYVDYSKQQWYLDQTGVRQAWQTANYRGSTSVAVAVIDTGVKYDLPELAANMWVNNAEIPNDGQDNDDNGYIDDYRGWDFLDQDNDPAPVLEGDVGDKWYHGTAVAGIIGAVHNNDGIDGINWSVRILPIRIADRDAKGLDWCGWGGFRDRLAKAIRYAANFDEVRVINLSLGVNNVGIDCITQAVDYAVSRGKLIVAGAGNDGSSNLLFPASLPNVVAVGGTDRSDHRSSSSQYGDALDVVAPSEDIVLLLPDNTYPMSWGTSFSTPQVSGLAALIMAANPYLTASQVRGYIEAYADEVGGYNYINGFHPEMGWGRINALKSLAAAAPVPIQTNTPPPTATQPPAPTTTPPPPVINDGLELCDGVNFNKPCNLYIYTANDTCINLANSGWDNRAESVQFKGNYIGNYDVIIVLPLNICIERANHRAF